jgi:hypothetical protein
MKEEGPGNSAQGLRTRLWVGHGLILATALLAASPLLIRGTSCGHDFDFHLVSWMDALHSWKQGILYPHWAPSPNFGAGEPRFIFYPPLTWMLGAALGAFLPWTAVPAVLTFLLLAGTGLATRALARQALADGASTLAGCTAIFSGYTLYTAYERSAFAELAGGIWIPLLVLLMLREGKQRQRASAFGDSALGDSVWSSSIDGTALLLALVIAAAWLSNAPVGVMASYLLAGVALLLAVIWRSWVPILRATVGATLGLGLAAYYLVPAAVEQRWVDIRQATDDSGEQIQNSFLFGHHADPQLALHDLELRRVSWIAVAMFLAALIGILVGWRRRKLPGSRGWWSALALVSCAILILQLPISLPLWNVLPKLRFLQFPWRWLVALEAPMGVFVAAAVWPFSRSRRLWLIGGCATAFLGLTFVAGRFFFQVCDDEDAIAPMFAAWRAGIGFQGTDEYAPPGADDSLVPINLPGACFVDDPEVELGKPDPASNPDWAADQHSCEATYEFAPDPGNAPTEHREIRGNFAHAGFLILRLRAFPPWSIRVNGQPDEKITPRQDGLIAVPVPAGPVDVTANWTTTADVVAGRWISALALALVTALAALRFRRRQVHLKATIKLS